MMNSASHLLVLFSIPLSISMAFIALLLLWADSTLFSLSGLLLLWFWRLYGLRFFCGVCFLQRERRCGCGADTVSE